MMRTVTIDRRFCGPADIGNGGYVCCVLGQNLTGDAEVTLWQPPPLERPMILDSVDGGRLRLLDGEKVIAEGAPACPDPDFDVPEPPTPEEAQAAGARSPCVTRPDEHPFPCCFVCGPNRRPGDGLRIFLGPMTDRDLCAHLWVPDPDLSAPDGAIRPEFVWAALDCASGMGALGATALDGPPFVLGRLTVRTLATVNPGEPCVITGWPIGRDGRKVIAGSAVFTADGALAARAQATWIRLAS
jgi:hypothetical protein